MSEVRGNKGTQNIFARPTIIFLLILLGISLLIGKINADKYQTEIAELQKQLTVQTTEPESDPVEVPATNDTCPSCPTCEKCQKCESCPETTCPELDCSEQTAELKKQKAELEDDNAELQDQISNLEDEKQTLQTQADNLQSQVNDLNTEKQNLQNSVNSLTNDKTNLETQVSTLETDKTNLQTQVSTLETEKSNLQTQVSTLETDKTNLQDSVNTLTTDKTNLETQVSTLESEKSNLETDKQNLSNQNNTLTTQNSTLTTEVNSLNSQIGALNTQIGNLNTQISNLQNIYSVIYIIDAQHAEIIKVKKGEDVEEEDIPSIPSKTGMSESEWSNDGKNIQADTIIYPIYYNKLTFIYDGEISSDYDPTITCNNDKICTETDNSIEIKIYEENQVLTSMTEEPENDDHIIGKIYITDADLDNRDEDSPDITGSGLRRNSLDNFGWYYGDEVIGELEGTPITSSMTITFKHIIEACVAKGSKVSMADGTVKNIEDIHTGDSVLTYDRYNGTIAAKNVTAVFKGKDHARVFDVHFSNGETLSIVDVEYLFDTDAKKYISISIDTYQDMVGKNVMYNDNGNIGITQITSIDYSRQVIEHYTLYTAESINYIVNGIVANAPIGPLTNTRYTIGDDFKIDQAQYEADVATYGTYTYEELAGAVTEETYNNFVLKDIKISVGKGYMTFEQFYNNLFILQEEIDTYSN